MVSLTCILQGQKGIPVQMQHQHAESGVVLLGQAMKQVFELGQPSIALLDGCAASLSANSGIELIIKLLTRQCAEVLMEFEGIERIREVAEIILEPVRV